ncbi:MAG: aspartate kinase, partial [Rhodothermales bacterium]|nr:aspartate kinase [Rhodothermales bacterium]
MSDEPRPLIVAKFGGTSVADAGRIEEVCKIVANTARDGRTIVVVSALGGMTDALVGSIDNAITRSGQPSESVAALVERFEKAATRLLPADSLSELFAVVNQHWADLGELLDGIFLLRECTPRTRDAVMAIGELVNAPLVAAALAARDVAALPVDARELIRTDNNFGEANVDIDASYGNIRRWHEAFPANRVAVVTGFVASTASKVTSTLGRSGSDYTATLIGGALDAERVEIWTDVDGVMSADPRVVNDAYTIDELSYVEAGEMAYFGAKVLHPRTMRPLIARSISLHIKNTFNPSAKGTIISKAGRPSGGMVKAITSVRDVAVLMIEGTGMAGVPG